MQSLLPISTAVSKTLSLTIGPTFSKVSGLISVNCLAPRVHSDTRLCLGFQGTSAQPCPAGALLT